MSTGIGSFCTRHVTTVGPNATVVEASKAMRQQHIGALVVVDEHGGKRPIGVVTDRDIVVEVVALGVAPETLKVSEIIQRPLACVDEDAGYAEAVRLMS